MTEREDRAKVEQSGAPKVRSKAERWTSILLVVAAGIYGFLAVLLVATPVPAWIAWGLLAATSALVAAACVAGIGLALWRKAGRARVRRQDRRQTSKAWARFWEDVAQRPVR
ncbi:MAG: hypothetical protein HY681_07665 [Chloroflexi bacterium]|nr:hypothetical protein [Chloroflexota bacterium]